MYIKRLESFDINSNEADLVVSDKMYEITCYCHPFNEDKIDSEFSLIGFMCNDIVITNNKFRIVKNKNYYAYSLNSKVVSAKDKLVAIGDILIKLDTPLPKDIHNGDFISFSVKRIDVVFN